MGSIAVGMSSREPGPYTIEKLGNDVLAPADYYRTLYNFPQAV
jgi:hypothetical protein